MEVLDHQCHLTNKKVSLPALYIYIYYFFYLSTQLQLSLTPLDSASDDGIEVLTPRHFLVGKALKAVSAPDLSKRNISEWVIQMEFTAKANHRLLGEME